MYLQADALANTSLSSVYNHNWIRDYMPTAPPLL